MQIIQKKITDLAGYSRNARTHDAEQVQQIAASIREFGFNNPILVDNDSTIVAGHGRLAAARQLGMDQVPCIVLGHLTDTQRRAYVIADNKIALNAGWDKQLLALEMGELRPHIDLALLGFMEKEVLELLPMEPTTGRVDPDAVPPPPETAITTSGDLWILGNHKLLCGDSTIPADWNTLLAGNERLSWFWTDPPYNVNYGDKAESLNNAQKGHRNCDRILNDHMPAEDFYRFLLAVFSAVFSSMDKGAAIYVAHSETERASFTSAFVQAGFKFSTNIIWKKNQLVLGRSDYQYIHEPIIYGWKPGAGHHWVGGRKQTTVIDLARSCELITTDRGTVMFPFGDQVLEVDGGGGHHSASVNLNRGRQAKEKRRSPNNETGRAGRALSQALSTAWFYWRRCFWWVGHHTDRCRATWALCAPYGALAKILRCYHQTLAGLHGSCRHPCANRRAVQGITHGY